MCNFCVNPIPAEFKVLVGERQDHMTITWPSHECHMTITWLSHHCHMTITWTGTMAEKSHSEDFPTTTCSTDDREDLRRLISCGAYFLKMNRATCWHSSGVLECVKIQLLPAWGKDMKSNYWTFLHSIHRGTHRDRVLRAGIHDGPDNVAKLDLQGVIDALLL